MADIITQLKTMGAKLVNSDGYNIKSAVKAFSDSCIDLERQYKAMYAIRQLYINKKMVFPHESAFMSASGIIKQERAARVLLLKAMNLVGANPKDYGLSVYGMSKNDVVNAYPTLKYNASELSAIPIFYIAASTIIVIIALTTNMIKKTTELKKLNMMQVGVDYYIKQGYTPQAALNQTTKDIDTAVGKKGMFSDLSDAAKYASYAVGAYIVYMMVSNKKGLFK